MKTVYDSDDIPEVSILDYYPTRIQETIKLSPIQLISSQFVLDFKNGHRPASLLAAKIVAEVLSAHFDLDQGVQVVFIPIPASSREDTEKRYHLFSYLVGKHCNVEDGHLWVNNWHETKKKHLSRDEDFIQDMRERWYVDYKRIKGARVIIFDDVKTRGTTSNHFIRRLQECGAEVIGKVFLSKTYFLKEHQATD